MIENIKDFIAQMKTGESNAIAPTKPSETIWLSTFKSTAYLWPIDKLTFEWPWSIPSVGDEIMLFDGEKNITIKVTRVGRVHSINSAQHMLTTIMAVVTDDY